jgi:hypothetical protein
VIKDREFINLQQFFESEARHFQKIIGFYLIAAIVPKEAIFGNQYSESLMKRVNH